MPRILGMLPKNMGSYPRFLEIVPWNVNCTYWLSVEPSQNLKIFNSIQFDIILAAPLLIWAVLLLIWVVQLLIWEAPLLIWW